MLKSSHVGRVKGVAYGPTGANVETQVFDRVRNRIGTFAEYWREARVGTAILLAAMHMPSALCDANGQNSHLLATQAEV
jgi:hypothetical protein